MILIFCIKPVVPYKFRITEAEQCIMMAAKIIAGAIDANYSNGYDWCINQVRSSHYMSLAHDLDIDKAISYLKQKDFQQVWTSVVLSIFTASQISK